ncbi:MAG TPA: VCBS domain-containing protein, partial [Sphingobium sp.]|nr:VCBS domain-containing protein [Sphingobium sp.]
MDFERDANVDAAADHQQAPGSNAPAHGGRAKAASHHHAHHHHGGAMRTVAIHDGVVVLPAGADINHIEVDGRNLIVSLPDGTEVVILDGAVSVPRLVVGDVEIPSVNLAALLIGEEPQPAAGPARSSGGNFLAADGNVGDPHGLGDLLPPTELSFTQAEQREILPIAPNNQPEVEIVTPNQPAGAINATAGVSEAGLPARGGEPAGSAAAGDSERTSGSIIFTAQDTPAVVTINGTAVTQVGQSVTTPLGVLTITSIADGSIGYSYVLSDNVVGTPPAEVFNVVVTDGNGDQATATLTISIADDAPEAVNDVDSVTEDGPLVADGNLLTGHGGTDANSTDGVADVQGADGAHVTTVGTFQGSFGSLVIGSDGGYSYTLANGNAAVQFLVPGETLTDRFSYTITDADGSTSTATLTVTINGADDGVTLTGLTNGPGANGAELVVQENHLADGSAPSAAALTQSGSFSVTGADGLASVTIGGVSVMANGAFVTGQVVTTPLGTLTITGFTATAQQGNVPTAGTFSYSFLLTDNSLAHSAAGADNIFQNFAVVATDRNGSTASGSIDVQIVDDLPVAHNDVDTVAAGTYGPERGNVITGEGTISGAAGADVKGADGAAVAGVASGAGVATLVDAATVGHGVHGLYGTLTLNSDGSYDYVRDAGTPGGVSDSFTYTLRDGDGDLSSATLRIDIANSDVMIISIPRIGEGTVVDEAGLNPGVGPAPGSNAAANVETTSGTITYTAPDAPSTVTINDVPITHAGQTITTGTGVLQIVAISEGRIDYSYTLTTDTNGDTVTDSFKVTVTDVDGDHATDTLVITVLDDHPTAVADADSVREDGPLVADGNVLTGHGGTDANSTDGVADVQGADGATVTAISFGGVAHVVGDAGEVVKGAYGSLLIQHDGSYVYTLDNENGVVQGLDSTQHLTESFTYTITDGDNDTSQATLTITIDGSNDGVTISGLDGEGPELTLRESNLADGSAPDAAALTQSGSFSLSALDGVSTITVGGQSVFADGKFVAGVTIANAYGTLSIDSFTPVVGADGDVIGGTIGYHYVLGDNTLLHTGANDLSLTDSFAVVVSDTDGSQANASLDVTVVDDVPHAVDDTGNVVTEDAAVNTLSGDVLTNDVSGADTPKSFVAWGADAATLTELNKYGVLTQNGDGSWSYVLDNSRAATQALGGSFSQDFTLNYTMKDGDGDLSSAKLVITVKGADDNARVTTLAATGPDASVNEAGLPTGSLHDGSHVTTGSFTVTASDGIANIVVGGTSFTLAQMQAFGTTNGVVDTGEGTLRLTGFDDTTGAVSYSYTLNATIDNDSKAGATPTAFDDLIVLTVNSVGGSTGSDDLIVRIVDDTPKAVDDAGGTVTEDGAIGSLSGNVLTNDVAGADQPKSFVAWSAADAATITELGKYGTLTQGANGTWSYVLDNSRPATQALGSGFSQDFSLHYTMQDADGDPSSATLVITVKGAADSATVTTAALEGPDASVQEAGLPSGSLHDGSHVTTGSFTATATDGIANIVVGGSSFTLSQMQTFATTNGVVNTGEGTLRLTGYDSSTGAVSYSYTLNATIDNDSKAGATPTAFDDLVVLTVNGIGGTTASDNLVVRIVDDAPIAVSDAGGTVTEDGAIGSVSGNVLTNDIAGADQPKSFVAWGAADAAAITELSKYGTLTQNANGSWSYALDNSRPATQALGSSFSQDFTLHYTMQDADGDQSSSTLVITVKGAADSATVTTASLNGPDATVYEAGLSTGSLNDGSNVTTGSFTVAATDGVKNIVVGGTTFTLTQMQAFGTTNGVVDTGEGTLRLTGYNDGTGLVSYSYTLKAALSNGTYPGSTDTGFDDSVALTVNGIGGTSASDNLLVRIVDDTPKAVDDAGGTVTEDGATGSVSGNVLTNDIAGADQPKSFVAWSAGDSATITELSKYGTLTQSANGNWTYALDNSR